MQFWPISGNCYRLIAFVFRQVKLPRLRQTFFCRRSLIRISRGRITSTTSISRDRFFHEFFSKRDLFLWFATSVFLVHCVQERKRFLSFKSVVPILQYSNRYEHTRISLSPSLRMFRINLGATKFVTKFFNIAGIAKFLPIKI